MTTPLPPAPVTLAQTLTALPSTQATIHTSFSHRTLARQEWQYLLVLLASRKEWRLLDLWAEPERVHLALLDGEDHGTMAVVSLECPDGGYPAVSPVRPGAIRLERAIRDLYALEAESAFDRRPWLNHGRFPAPHPLAGEHPPTVTHWNPAAPYPFWRAESTEPLHQIPLGPIHGSVSEPVHFRFHANGETVVRLEERLGYGHRGIESLFPGRSLEEAAALAGRISGDSTAAYAWAFAMAVEAAVHGQPPLRALHLRAVIAELERVANHLGDIGAIALETSYAQIHTHATLLREQLLRANGHCFGHRLLMDRIVPFGVAMDLDATRVADLQRLVAALKVGFEAIVAAYDDKPSLLDRTHWVGVVDSFLAYRFGASGFIGRASGVPWDARRLPGYPPYDGLDTASPSRRQGDVHSRLWIRVEEVRSSLKIIATLLDHLPVGLIREESPMVAGEGVALVESFRGELWCWVRIGANGRLDRVRFRDPSWMQWPLLERAIKDTTVADFPLVLRSFNCSGAGHDL